MKKTELIKALNINKNSTFQKQLNDTDHLIVRIASWSIEVWVFDADTRQKQLYMTTPRTESGVVLCYEFIKQNNFKSSSAIRVDRTPPPPGGIQKGVMENMFSYEDGLCLSCEHFTDSIEASECNCTVLDGVPTYCTECNDYLKRCLVKESCRSAGYTSQP